MCQNGFVVVVDQEKYNVFDLGGLVVVGHFNKHKGIVQAKKRCTCVHLAVAHIFGCQIEFRYPGPGYVLGKFPVTF